MRTGAGEAIRSPLSLAYVPRAALRGVIEEYVSRAGTDDGAREKRIEEKIVDVERQLERGEAVIVFNADTATRNIVPARDAITDWYQARR